MTAEFWRGKRVFVTGHTGFKGAWLSLWLAEMGAVVGDRLVEEEDVVGPVAVRARGARPPAGALILQTGAAARFTTPMPVNTVPVMIREAAVAPAHGWRLPSARRSPALPSTCSSPGVSSAGWARP